MGVEKADERWVPYKQRNVTWLDNGDQQTNQPTKKLTEVGVLRNTSALDRLNQWFPKCGARPPGGGGRKRCETILFTKNK
jgi:hypothetical protein